MVEIATAIISMIGTLGAAYLGSYAQRQAVTEAGVGTPRQPSNTFRRISLIAIPVAMAIGLVVYFLASSLGAPQEAKPLTIPPGFKVLSWKAARIGLAIPETWWSEPLPITLQLDGPREEDGILLYAIPGERSEVLTLEANFEDQLDDLGEAMKVIMPFFEYTGAPIARSIHGKSGFLVPVRIAFPEEEPIEAFQYWILDPEHSRVVVLMYADNEDTQRVLSTINFAE